MTEKVALFRTRKWSQLQYHRMSAAIVISSSPTTTFARSQTPVRVSSSPQSSARATDDWRRQEYRRTTTRDGFYTSVATAKQALGTRSSAENVPVRSTSPPKARPPPNTNLVKSPPPTRYPSHADSGADWDAVPLTGCTVVRVLPSDVKRKKKIDNAASLELKKAVARKKDWTPTKLTQTWSGDTSKAVSGFDINFAKTFGHIRGDVEVERTANAGDGALIKRRRIDLSSTGTVIPTLKPKPVTKTAKPRSKSPAKKGLTITGLATSRYFGEEKDQQATIMKQFFVSTQVRREEDRDPDTFETKVKKKASSRKRQKSRLRSPETALKTLDSQEVVFATASQCARDESPTLIRDINEALKQSMEQLPSSPIRTQQTAIYSVESTTPQKTGLSRFRSRKRLWTAADRDENDALLHMDDPFDTLDLKDAFAGKDALFEHAASIPNLDETGDSLDLLATLKAGGVPAPQPDEPTFDIDDMTTPPVTIPKPSTVQIRAFSASARSPSPSKRTKKLIEIPMPTTEPGMVAESALSAKRTPAKPNYASWTDEYLKEKVKEYGFHRIRARKTMIDKLDEVWAEQNGLDPVKVKAATKAASQQKKVLQGGDILDTVHDLAARPASKIKKPKARKNNEDGNNEDKPKRKRKGKAIEETSRPVEETIVDISDLDNSTAFDRLTQMTVSADGVLQSYEPSTAPVTGTGVKASTKREQGPLTPPPTILPKPTQQSSPGFESPSRRHESPIAILAESLTSSQIEEVPVSSLIRKAIQSPPADNATRCHQKNPTWHEKMLMYDPIILEDLTLWLNTEGFNAIGEDREINIVEVKDWCHENGICCLWRGGWRGNKKAKGEE